MMLSNDIPQQEIIRKNIKHKILHDILFYYFRDELQYVLRYNIWIKYPIVEIDNNKLIVYMQENEDKIISFLDEYNSISLVSFNYISESNKTLGMKYILEII